MPQEGENTPQEGQEPTPATEEGQEPKGEEKSTPETFDKEYVSQLRAEAAKHRKEAQEAKAKVEEYESANQTELEKLTGKLTKTEERAQKAEGTLLRFKVAAEKKLPPELVERLQGSSEEELSADADKLLELVTKAEENPDFDGGAREPAPEPREPADAHNESVLALMGLVPNK